MNKDLFKALEALCLMWSQYCDTDNGHMFMSAGEHTMEVLIKWGLLKNIEGPYAEVNEHRLEFLRKLTTN